VIPHVLAFDAGENLPPGILQGSGSHSLGRPGPPGAKQEQHRRLHRPWRAGVARRLRQRGSGSLLGPQERPGPVQKQTACPGGHDYVGGHLLTGSVDPGCNLGLKFFDPYMIRLARQSHGLGDVLFERPGNRPSRHPRQNKHGNYSSHGAAHSGTRCHCSAHKRTSYPRRW